MSSVVLVMVCRVNGPVIAVEACANTLIANAWREQYKALGHDGTYTLREEITEHMPPKGEAT